VQLLLQLPLRRLRCRQLCVPALVGRLQHDSRLGLGMLLCLGHGSARVFKAHRCLQLCVL
jgi:hypothetical protein